MIQELLNFDGIHQFRMALLMKEDESTYPMHIRFFRARTEMPTTASATYTIHKARGIRCGRGELTP
jgi:hypothetical protein